MSTLGAGWGAITTFVRGTPVKHSVIDAHNALLLVLLSFGSNPEDRHQQIFSVLVDVGILVALSAKVFIALMPQKLHS